MFCHHATCDWFDCWGLTTHQPLWVILCRPSEKGRRAIGDSRGDEREGQGRKENEWNWRNRRNKNIPPSTFTCCKDSRPCPTVRKYQLHDTFASPSHPTGQRVYSVFGTPVRKFMLDLSVFFVCFFVVFFNSAKVLIHQLANKMIVYGRQIIS